MIIYVFEDDPFHPYVKHTLNNIKDRDREKLRVLVLRF